MAATVPLEDSPKQEKNIIFITINCSNQEIITMNHHHNAKTPCLKECTYTHY